MTGYLDGGSETNWFAIQAKPFRENLAASSISKLDLEVFLPKIKQEQLVCGIWRVVAKPLFPGYLFARLCPLLSLDAVRYARGVLRVVGTSRFPIPLDAEIILAFQNRVQSNGFIELKPQTFECGDEVTIERGPFAGWIGKVEREYDDGKRTMILLEAIQNARVVIDRESLEAVAA